MAEPITQELVNRVNQRDAGARLECVLRLRLAAREQATLAASRHNKTFPDDPVNDSDVETCSVAVLEIPSDPDSPAARRFFDNSKLWRILRTKGWDRAVQWMYQSAFRVCVLWIRHKDKRVVIQLKRALISRLA